MCTDEDVSSHEEGEVYAEEEEDVVGVEGLKSKCIRTDDESSTCFFPFITS